MSRRARLQLSKVPETLRPGAATWPRRLADLKTDAPAELFVAGTLPSLAGAVAVVGTRFADEDALSFTRELTSALSLAGRVVVSGGAEGVDAAAHRGCLDVGGPTVAVLATGLVRAYPPQHGALFEAIAEQGALISEAHAPNKIAGWAFLRRNRLIAALAESVVVVQAPARSGALSTARWAQTVGRTLFAVPAAPWDRRGGGCLDLIRSGARICTSAKDVLSLPPSEGATAVPASRVRTEETNDDSDLSEPARTLWEHLRTGPRYPDELGVCLDMPAARVQEGLLTLLLVGRVRRRADGTYEKTRNP